MVLAMTTYNLSLVKGFSSQIFPILLKELWVVFLIALFFDVVVISNTTKKLALSLISKKNITNLPAKILIISTSMVVGMVICMSLFGSINAVGFSREIGRVYPRIALMNFIVAWPLNIIIANPLARLVHSSIFRDFS
jgi:uncharacterized integral membrane protein